MMASPFPGMDPYLEDPEIWPGFHHSLAEELKAQLNAGLGPRYYADVNARTVLEEVVIAAPHVVYPDVGIMGMPVREPAVAERASVAAAIAPAPLRRMAVVWEEIRLRTVEVRQIGSDQLVTAIEILSPYNKRPGEGLDEYREKRRRILRSAVHLIEIDLLRGGERPGREVLEPPLDTDYVLLVNRYEDDHGRVSDIWAASLDAPLPLLPVPLLSPDPDLPLYLGAAIETVYERGAYGRRINYRSLVPPPGLRPAVREWAAQYLPQVG